MAEAAGLVIGGVGLAALFDSCINAFDYVESGTKYGRDYNKAALKISLLQLRLARWKDTVRFVEDETSVRYSGALVASPEESDKVRDLLGHIEDEFEDAERRAKKYVSKETPVVPNLERTDTTIAALTKKVQQLAKTRQKAASLQQKARWALHDRVKFQRLIEDQKGYIDTLVELFPAMEIRLKGMANSDASTLASPIYPDEKRADNLGVLRDVSREVDPALERAVERIGQPQSSHQFIGETSLSGKARLAEGDYVAANYSDTLQQGPCYVFGGKMTASDNARVMRGTNYGGKSVFDD